MTIDAGAAFQLSLDDSEIDRVAKRTAEKVDQDREQPLLKDFAQAYTITTNPQCIVINNMIPGYGRVWEIVQAGVFGLDGHTVVASAIADIYAGPVAGTDAPGDFAAFLSSGTVPCNFLIGAHKCYVYGGDRIYAWIYGITSGTLTLAGTIRDWELKDRTKLHIPSYHG